MFMSPIAMRSPASPSGTMEGPGSKSGSPAASDGASGGAKAAMPADRFVTSAGPSADPSRVMRPRGGAVARAPESMTPEQASRLGESGVNQLIGSLEPEELDRIPAATRQRMYDVIDEPLYGGMDESRNVMRIKASLRRSP